MNMEDGVWRTVGGRRIFIKNGQDLSSAMKASGKFNKKKKKIDLNDHKEIDRIADSYENIDNYELDDITRDYIKNRRKEMAQAEFTNKANEIHEKSLARAIENEKSMDEDKRYNTNSEANDKELTFEEKREYLKKKNIDALNNFTKDDDDTFIRKEYDRQKKAEEAKESEKTTDEDKRYNTKSETKRLEEIQRQAQAKYDHAKDKYEHYKFDDGEDAKKYREEYNKAKDELTKADREYGEHLAKESGKSILINEYNKTTSRGSMSDDSFIEQARKSGMSDEQIAKEVYKKHNGPESNNTSDNNIKRLLAKQKKEEALAKGDKDTASRFERYEKEFESRVSSNEDWVKKAFAQYKKDHPRTKLTINDFKRQQK